MSRILIADIPKGAITLERILLGHDCTVVTTMADAETILKSEAFDLIVAGLHFDDSQMFELIREVKKSQNNNKPIICFCSRDTQMSRLLHESLECSTKALGAWMYLAEHAYNVYQNPDAELRRVMERCLTEESRKEIQLQRLAIEKQRADLQQFRMLLQEQAWTPDLKEYLAGLQQDLDLLLKELTRLHSASDDQRASVEVSRDLKDRVADRVSVTENDMTSTEDIQSAAETGQTAEEGRLTTKEELREAVGQNDKRDLLEKDEKR